jgi:PncC family amidohydrolase
MSENKSERILAAELQETLFSKHLWLAVAESCTGGLLGSLITDQPGSSGIFLGGIIAYANEIKTHLLHVQETTLEAYGAVSQETAAEMAAGIRRVFENISQPRELIVGVSITGIAGPGGGTPGKPVGTVCIGIESHSKSESHSYFHPASRQENKLAFCRQALLLLKEHLMKVD